jgi:hypothetical protein
MHNAQWIKHVNKVLENVNMTELSENSHITVTVPQMVHNDPLMNIVLLFSFISVITLKLRR